MVVSRAFLKSKPLERDIYAVRPYLRGKSGYEVETPDTAVWLIDGMSRMVWNS